jgi:hypothetical protein
VLNHFAIGILGERIIELKIHDNQQHYNNFIKNKELVHFYEMKMNRILDLMDNSKQKKRN